MLKRIESAGCYFAYRVRGAGEPIIFIQGVGLHGDGWLPQVESLSSSFRCLTFDNRGMGQSQPAAVAITVEQMAEDTLAIMDSEGMAAVHLVGHSLGGLIAQQIALSCPKRVLSLSLLCTSARGADATRFSPTVFWLGLRSRVGSRSMRRLAFLKIILSADYLLVEDAETLAERFAPLFGHDLAENPQITMPQLGALKRFDATSRLPELASIPVLVLSAEYDLIFPPQYGRALAAGIPGASYIEIVGAAHGVTLQFPDQVNSAVVRHLMSVKAPI